MKKGKYYPFSSGTQYMDWERSNCKRCKKYCSPEDKEFRCDIDKALFDAFCDDGSVSKEIAKRMGFIGNEGAQIWMCPEVEWTDEWKQELDKRFMAKRSE